jgi:hypothetical protein
MHSPSPATPLEGPGAAWAMAACTAGLRVLEVLSPASSSSLMSTIGAPNLQIEGKGMYGKS